MTEREFPLTGWTVERVTFDFQTSLLLLPPDGSDRRDCVVILTSDFELEGAEGQKRPMVPGPPFDGADQILALHRGVVARFAANADGVLTIEFDDGRTLRAFKDQQFESWQTLGEVNLLCSPHDAPPWGRPA